MISHYRPITLYGYINNHFLGVTLIDSHHLHLENRQQCSTNLGIDLICIISNHQSLKQMSVYFIVLTDVQNIRFLDITLSLKMIK